jgi:signal transduction histidine kinase
MPDGQRLAGLRRLLRSFALRTSLGIAAAALLLSLVGAGWGWSRAETALRQELDLVLAGEAEGLIRDYQAIGPGALLDAAKVAARRDALLVVLVQTADGQTLAGRMDGAPAALQGYATLRAPGEPPLRALGALLPGGINLIVAAPLAPAEDAARALAWTPLIAALGSGAVALLLGFVGARALERRLASVSDVAGLLTAGDLSRRLPQSGRGDEFDRLVMTVNAMLARLEALVAAQRQVTDDIAHDLRGPLQRLRQGLEEALASRRDDPALAMAIAELDDVLGTFAALLRIARAEAGTASLQAVDLSALVMSVAEAYAPVAEDAGRPFAIDIVPGLTLHGDPALLGRMLANLLDNALAHGAGAISVSLTAGKVLVVSDAGPGVPAAERTAVLERFVRLDRSRGTPGTGLGLALVKAAAQAHGASVVLGPRQAEATGLAVTVDFGGARHLPQST